MDKTLSLSNSSSFDEILKELVDKQIDYGHFCNIKESGIDIILFVRSLVQLIHDEGNHMIEVLEKKQRQMTTYNSNTNDTNQEAFPALYRNNSSSSSTEKTSFGESNLASPLTSPRASSSTNINLEPLNLAKAFQNIDMTPKMKREISLLARMYSKIIQTGSIEDVTSELTFIFGVLRMIELFHREKHNEPDTEELENVANEVFPVKRSIPCWSVFIGALLLDLEPFLTSFGSSITRLLTKFVTVQRFAGIFSRRVGMAMDAMETRHARNSNLADNDLSMARFWVPFQEYVDSRDNYKSGVLMDLYNNRERIKDQFSQALRSFREEKHKLLDPTRESSATLNNGKSSTMLMHDTFRMLQPQNIYWFADYFLGQFTLACSSSAEIGEQKIFSNQDPRKMELLGGRLSQPQIAATSQSYANIVSPKQQGQVNILAARRGRNANSSSRVKSNESVSHVRKKTSSKSPHRKSAPHGFGNLNFNHNKSNDGGLEICRMSFEGNEEFFFKFLLNWDSHRLNSVLQSRLVTELHVLNNVENISKSAQSPDEFGRRLVAAKLLGKLLGFVLFSPNWYSSDTVLSDERLAFLQGLTVPINVLPVNSLLEIAENEGVLCFTVPWICCFVGMAECDKVTRSSTEFQSWLDRLGKIRNRTNAVATQDLFLRTEIEQIQSRIPGTGRYFEKSMPPLEHKISQELLGSDEFRQRCWKSAETLRSLLAKSLSSFAVSRKRVEMKDQTLQPPITAKAPAKTSTMNTLRQKDFSTRLGDGFFKMDPQSKRIADFCVNEVGDKVLAELLDSDKTRTVIKLAVQEARSGKHANVEEVAFCKASTSVLQDAEQMLNQSVSTMFTLCTRSASNEVVLRSAINATIPLCMNKIEHHANIRLKKAIAQAFNEPSQAVTPTRHSHKQVDAHPASIWSPSREEVDQFVKTPHTLIPLLLNHDTPVDMSQANTQAILELAKELLPCDDMIQFCEAIVCLCEASVILSPAAKMVETTVCEFLMEQACIDCTYEKCIVWLNSVFNSSKSRYAINI